MSEIPPPTVPPTTPPPPGGTGGSYVPPPPPPPPPAGGGGPTGGGDSDRTLMVILSYAWFASLIPMLTKKEDPDIQWHAKNGFVMAVAITLVEIVFWVIARFFPLVACLVSFVPCLIWVAYLVIQIVCIVKAMNRERFRVPVLTDFAEKM